MKTRIVMELEANHRRRVLLDIAQLPRSTFAYHRARVDHPDRQAALKAAVRGVYDHARGRYGHRRIHDALHAEGWVVGEKTVLQVMREEGLVCQVRRKRTRQTTGVVGKRVANILNRKFRTHAPNTTWVADMTEFRIGRTKRYLVAMVDLFDRQVIAYAVGPSPTLELSNTVLRHALATLPAGSTPLLHTDQGFQFQHASWQQRARGVGVLLSMSRRGTCLDNAMAENFFSHLKTEFFYLQAFGDVDEFERELHAYIRWYNTERISRTLMNKSPIAFRAHWLARQS